MELEDMSYMSSCGMFCSYSYRDIGRRKCTFCLSLLSVLFVVWSTLIINTLVFKGPVVFLKLAEAQTGEFDAVVTNPKKDEFETGSKLFLNFTRI